MSGIFWPDLLEHLDHGMLGALTALLEKLSPGCVLATNTGTEPKRKGS